MTAPFDPGRRRLLLAAAGLAASAALGPRTIGLMLDRLATAGSLESALRDLVTHRDSAASLGRAYLAVMPGEASAVRLVPLILGKAAAPIGQEGARVRSRIQADFDAAQVVTIDGWIVSRTEARLCALCALG